MDFIFTSDQDDAAQLAARILGDHATSVALPLAKAAGR